MTGWRDGPGGGLLYQLILEAFVRAADSDEAPPEWPVIG